MAASVQPPFVHVQDANGIPYSGAALYVYAAGTTTKLTLYSDSGLSVARTNPIISDSSGNFARAYLPSAVSYKLRAETSAAVLIWEYDNIDPGTPIGAGALSITSGGTGATTATTARSNLGAASSAEVSAMAATLASQAASITTNATAITQLDTDTDAALALRVRVDAAQSFNDTQKAQARANAPPFAAGTIMLFQQSTAPVGWTKNTTHNDKALRVVSGAAGSGGSIAFSTLFGRVATDAHTITQANLPSVDFTVTIPSGQGSHGHAGSTVAIQSGDNGTGTAGKPVFGGSTALTIASATLPAMSGTAASGGSGTGHTHGLDMQVQFVDLILATKD